VSAMFDRQHHGIDCVSDAETFDQFSGNHEFDS